MNLIVLHLVEFQDYGLKPQHGLISLIPATRYARVEFREFTGAVALQYLANFAFRIKVINDAHIDRVRHSINYENFEG